MPDAIRDVHDRLEAGCASAGGTFKGVNTTCAMAACPVVLTPFVDPLPILPVAQSTTLSEVQFQRKVHRDLPPTTLWGFDDGTGPQSPGPTIVAQSGTPLDITWQNDLPATHVLGVDRCLAADDVPRSIIHLHGGHVPPASDGYPTDAVPPGGQTADHYPNKQGAATLWYHDHAMGITRLNVTMGLAGFYLIHDADETALDLPSGADDIPLILQDRTFGPDGQIRYPATWQPTVLGDKILVNGMVWPYLNVPRGKVRFRHPRRLGLAHVHARALERRDVHADRHRRRPARGAGAGHAGDADAGAARRRRDRLLGLSRWARRSC